MFNLPIFDRILNYILNGDRKHFLADKLNSIYTPTILIFFALIISSKQLIGSPINCIIPFEYKGSWDNYVENYCFLTQVNDVSNDEKLPFDMPLREQRSYNYYAWIPIILTIQSLVFCFPLLLWNYFSTNTQVDYQKCVNTNNQQNFFKSLLKRYKQNDWYNDCFLTILYLSVKILYIINIFFQFYILGKFFGFDFLKWGYFVLLENSFEYFPIINFCNFNLVKLGSIMTNTVQCFFSINLFNKFAFMFVWFWLLILLVINCITFIYWLVIIAPMHRLFFVKLYIDRKNLRIFTRECLTADIFLMLLSMREFETELYIIDFLDNLYNVWHNDRKMFHCV